MYLKSVVSNETSRVLFGLGTIKELRRGFVKAVWCNNSTSVIVPCMLHKLLELGDSFIKCIEI